MKYFYNSVNTLNNNPSLLNEINLAAERLHKKFLKLNIGKSSISEYNQKYLSDQLDNPVGTLQRYTHLLALSLDKDYLSPLDKFVFVDYGGGSGILALLAKELGIGRVIYNDIYDVSCNDMKVLSRNMNINIDDYVCGDIDELISYFKKKQILINAISSHDVIEHIYDVEDYLKKLRLVSNTSFRIVFSSTANSQNPLIERKLKKIHKRCEYRDRYKVKGHKKRDSLKNYFDLRKEIIKNYSDFLTEEVIDNIAVITRGLRKQDIEKCVDEYIKSGKIHYKSDHPTNTCDPITGNWAEHIMSTNYLKKILQDEGFFVRILSGYWQYSDHRIKLIIKNILNMCIKLLGGKGLFIAPAYIISADYNH